MKRLFLEIPNTHPKLDIECHDEKIMEYLYHVFSPYIFQQATDSKRYVKLKFSENELGELVVECDDKLERVRESVVAYLQKYLLKESYTDKDFLLLHGGSVVYNNRAFVFLANSMTGKSTLVAHLCMKHFEYITDDRVLIDLNSIEVLPFTKIIMLRPEGKEILEKRYGHNIQTTSFEHRRMIREFFKPELCRQEKTPLYCIFILERKNEGKIDRRIIEGQEKIAELLKFSMSIKDCQKISKFIRLCNVRVEKVFFSDLNEMVKTISDLSLETR